MNIWPFLLIIPQRMTTTPQLRAEARYEALQKVFELESALAQNLGVSEVVVDGVRVKYDRKQLLEELRFWKRKLAYATRRRRVSSGINLGGA